MKKNLISIIWAGAILASSLVNNSYADPQTDYKAYLEYTGNFEGRRSQVYDPNPNDGKGEPTVGIGHYLDRKDSRKTFERVLPEVDYDNIYSGREKLTDSQIDRLFMSDIVQYENIARNYFAEFDSYPTSLKQALVDGCYRGDLIQSPKTRRLINEGKLIEASKEYLNNREYKNAIKKSMRGVRTRMGKNACAMLEYGLELKKNSK